MNTGRKTAHETVVCSFRLRTNEMNTYKCLVKLDVTKTIKTTTNVVVQANDAYKAKLQLEAMYGKNNLVNYPQLVCTDI